MTPKDIAKRAVQTMWDADTASKWAGMELLDAGPDTAEVSMDIGEDHCNGHGTAHGGVIYMLAGTTFAMAINSRNERAVAQSGSITYIAPVQKGDKLTAQARCVAKSGRNGIFDVRICNQDDKTVAEFRGNSRTIGGTLYDEESPA